AEWAKPRSLEPARQQHPKGLMCKASFERIANEIALVLAREGLDQQLPRQRYERPPLLNFQPLPDLRRQWPPFPGVGNDLSDAIGQVGGERKFPALVGRHFGVFRSRSRDIDLVLDQRLVAQNLSGEDEGVAGSEHLDEIFLDLAQKPPAARNHLR